MQNLNADLDTIGRIYDAALDPSAWTSILDAVVERSGAAGMGLFVEDPTAREFELAAVSSIFTPELLEEHFEIAHEADQAAYRHLRRMPPFRLFTEREVMEGRMDWQSLPGRAWLRQRLGIEHRIAGHLNDKGVWDAAVALQFRAATADASRARFTRGEMFLPHLGRVVEMSRTFAVLRSRFQAVVTALDRYHVGVLVLAPGGQVVVRNREAERILDLDDGLTLGADSRVRARRADDHARLVEACRRVADTARACNDTAQEVLSITRRSGEDAFLLEVSPLTGSGDELDAGFAGVYLLVVDPARTSRVSVRGMELLYDLSDAEATVCRLVAEGHETQDIADMRSVSRETVRAQVKSILRKTGVANRSHLVRLALTVNLPIDEVPSGGDPERG
jgi:DNA-binding CsgD family transcriptional regulator